MAFFCKNPKGDVKWALHNNNYPSAASREIHFWYTNPQLGLTTFPGVPTCFGYRMIPAQKAAANLWNKLEGTGSPSGGHDTFCVLPSRSIRPPCDARCSEMQPTNPCKCCSIILHKNSNIDDEWVILINVFIGKEIRANSFSSSTFGFFPDSLFCFIYVHKNNISYRRKEPNQSAIYLKITLPMYWLLYLKVDYDMKNQ